MMVLILDTGGGILNIINSLNEKILLLNPDTLWEIIM